MEQIVLIQFGVITFVEHPNAATIHNIKYSREVEGIEKALEFADKECTETGLDYIMPAIYKGDIYHQLD